MMFTTSPSLLERLRVHPDSRTWERFVHLYSPLLLVWVTRAGFTNDAADVVQEALIRLIKDLPRYERRPGVPFRAWLRRVVLNTVRDYRAAHRNRPLPTTDDLNESPDADPWPDDQAEYRSAVIHRALDLIRPDFSRPVWTAFTETALRERRPASVATELGMTVGAVYAAKSRVLARLREELGELLD